MKLAFIVKGGLHASGRVQVMPGWLALLERLAGRHEVHAFSMQHLSAASTYPLRGFTVHDLGSPGRTATVKRWAEWRALRRALTAAGPFDVVHGFWITPGGLLATVAGWRFGVPSVVTCNSGEFSAIDDVEYGLQRSVVGRVVVRMTCRLASRVHVATTYMERLASAHGCRAITIAMGVDSNALRPPANRNDEKPWRLLSVAGLNRVKDHATLLEAFAIVCRGVDVRLDLVGEDWLGGALQAQTSRLGIAERVSFHGYCPFDELLPFYQQAHVYVQSSRHEGAGAAVMEAAACGLPIVGTAVGYVADWSPDGAVAVAPHDPIALAHAITAVLGDRDRRLRLGAHARAFAEAHDVEWTAQHLEALYASLRP